MVFAKTLLLLLLIAVGLIAAVTVVFAVLGSRRGRAETWGRNAFTVALGVVFISGVVTAAVLSIRALHSMEGAPTLEVYSTPSGNYVAQATPDRTAAPVYTPPPGTVITPTPRPELITGVNYGAGFSLTDCNDYVYVMEDSSLYAGPASSYDAVGSISAGATVNRKAYTSGWSLVDYGGNYCFIPTDVLLVNE